MVFATLVYEYNDMIINFLRGSAWSKSLHAIEIDHPVKPPNQDMVIEISETVSKCFKLFIAFSGKIKQLVRLSCKNI